MNDLSVSRLTATKYLNELCKLDLLLKHKIGKENYYINKELFALLANVNKVGHT
ncbi:MAG: hypothetical protein ACI9FN_003144 [Saprospiraceae bacterium]|jgi:hypothetical protein